MRYIETQQTLKTVKIRKKRRIKRVIIDKFGGDFHSDLGF